VEDIAWVFAFFFAGVWPIALLHSWAKERKQDTAAEILKYMTYVFALFASYGASTGDDLRQIPKPDRMESSIVAILFWWIAIALVGLGFYSVVHLFWIMPLACAIPWYFGRMESHTRLYVRIGSIFAKSSIPVGIVIGALMYLNK
jgi:hypothetical protein